MLLRFFFPTTCIGFRIFFRSKLGISNSTQFTIFYHIKVGPMSAQRQKSTFLRTYTLKYTYVRPKISCNMTLLNKKSKNMFFRRQILNITINRIFFCGHFDVQFIHFRIKFMKKFLVKSILTYPYTVLYGKKKKKMSGLSLIAWRYCILYILGVQVYHGILVYTIIYIYICIYIVGWLRNGSILGGDPEIFIYK